MEKNNANKKVAFYTLGCKLNFSETSTISRDFEKNGYSKVNFTSEANVYVINTCTVTELADKKCRNAIRRAVKKSPEAKIIAIGCYAQLKPEVLSQIKGIDLILGNHEKFKIFDYLKSTEKTNHPEIYTCPIEMQDHFSPSYSINDRTRSFLKIQDGCDYHCSYCTIPLARGKSRNQPIKEIIKQAIEIGQSGVKEIVLTGVNTGDFGKSTGESFLELIKKLDKIDAIERIRISSIEPNLLTDAIIEFVNGSNKFVPHYHIPLQSGCNDILKLMQRRYKRELFAEKINSIHEINPYSCIGVDVIVGFPGETDEMFDETKSFLGSLDISYLHVFTYSERKNTKSALMDNKVSDKEKNIRSKTLLELSEKKRLQFYSRNIGHNVNVLFESQNQAGKMFGFTENYIKIEADYNTSFVNKVCKGKITRINSNFNCEIELYNES